MNLIPMNRLSRVGRKPKAAKKPRRSTGAAGKVFLVGAGPGDPELLTLMALRILESADVVVYDHLVSSAVLKLASSAAERIYVGKERNNHTLPQESINDLLVRLAKKGLNVVRLKGGDPFIFGRGGEEIETLAAQKVPFQVVPGITAATGVAAYSGIPLTHRNYAQACTFVTGHLKDGSADLDWKALARPRQTVVVYMGLQGLAVICGKLMEHGMPGTTPAAIVQRGTTRSQKVVTGALETLPGLAKQARLKAPTLIIIGEVVKLRDQLAWFEQQAEALAEAEAAG